MLFTGEVDQIFFGKAPVLVCFFYNQLHEESHGMCLNSWIHLPWAIVYQRAHVHTIASPDLISVSHTLIYSHTYALHPRRGSHTRLQPKQMLSFISRCLAGKLRTNLCSGSTVCAAEIRCCSSSRDLCHTDILSSNFTPSLSNQLALFMVHLGL